MSSSVKTALLQPDSHWPFEDKKAWELVMRAGEVLKPHWYVILGDALDLFSVSAHDKDPSRKLFLDDEIEYAKRKLIEIGKRIKPKEKIFIAGNHCYRLERYLIKNAPELFKSVKIQDLLELDKLGWRYVPYRDHYQIGKLFLTHDCGKAGANAHTDARDAFEGNVVIGHTHRMAYAVKGNVKNKPHFGAMLGWLGSADAADYMFKIRAARDWTLGFGVAYVEAGGNVHLETKPLVNYRVVINGKILSL
jgi:predicted phosphodiesterase